MRQPTGLSNKSNVPGLAKSLLTVFLISISFQYARAEDPPEPLESPVYVPEVLTFFNRELEAVLSYTSGSRPGGGELFKAEWYLSTVYDFDPEESGSAYLNCLGGIHFRIGSFRLPFFAAVVTEAIDRKAAPPAGGYFYSSYLGFFGGSGLVYDNRYFALGTFAGYYETREYAKYETEILKDSGRGSFSFTVIPILYTGEMLYLNILKDIIGKLNATRLGINDIALQLRSRSFHLYTGAYDFSLYYLRESYVSIAKNRIYGARVSADLANYFKDFYITLSLEGGYRDFFDISYNRYAHSYYADTAFVKAGADFIWKEKENTGGLRFTVLFDRQNIPQIGAYLFFRRSGNHVLNGISGAELGKQVGISFKVFQELSGAD
ncbi:MAG: hypothetical protein FWH38_05990 [Treponema sp.]|nr:hypothetical protein [Treponema sp.]